MKDRDPAPVTALMPLPFKPSRLRGLSRDLMLSHYENNYGGALRRLNVLERELAALDYSRALGVTINGLKREALIAANSVILHEIYFDGLGGPGGEPAGELAGALVRDFGTTAAWRSEFVAMGKALAGGSGWVLLTYSGRFRRLVNQWAADHTHTLAEGVPILALDMYEHSYHLDFAANAAAYVDAFMENVHWERVDARYQRAVGGAAVMSRASAETEVPSISAEELRAVLERGEQPLVLDVRLSDDFAMGKDMVVSAQYRDPEEVADWAEHLPRDRPVVAYCAYGFEVCQGVTAALRNSGVDARFLRGGIAAWHAIAAPTGFKP
jgi:superoxide dismutase, Fe-Mn family